ncbi:hypothetical protein OAO60_00445 [bacterium]|nr:hypothetical protein [Gammaproteobacteria bacterium]MDC0570073.1 hypothetical protein [bacterium]MDA9867399.1 hypothetical protein [Gammaproteobacteria bacterium]MDC0466926.1 hypothetical protein [Gammaproteobacteria bacterium]MDC1007605.1 hypothetical protein [Gammaproteobacteria bacterium]
MKTFSTVFIFLLFTLTSYLNSSEIKQTTFAYWDKPDVEIFYLTPKKIDINTQILFVIHGNNRNAEDYISAWIPFIENKNIILVAPKFDKKNFRYFFLLESATSSGEINKNSDEYINKSISLFFNFFKSKYSLDTNKYKMFGHSAGAQFTHRYMLLSDDRRISNAVIANAGWYTFLNGENFPYGIKNTPIDISNDHIKWFMSNKASLLIGNNDTKLNNVNSSKGAMRQGITRVDRANTYFKSLVNISDNNNIPFRWSFKVIDGVSHDYTKMTTEAAKILLQDINFIN